ncbi:hypothetical protein ACHAXT_012774 [Thalassiosira profunda]
MDKTHSGDSGGSGGSRGYVKIVQTPVGDVMTESEFLARPIPVEQEGAAGEEAPADAAEEDAATKVSAATDAPSNDAKETANDEGTGAMEAAEGSESQASSMAEASAGGEAKKRTNNRRKKKRKGKRKVEKLILLGERHSGTNWITDHLRECFGDDVEITDEYKRQKHWFQEEDLNRVPANSAVVVAMFRDPYNWVEAMRVEPHHSPDHVVWHNGSDSVWHDVWYRNKTSVGLDANNTDGRLSCWQYRGWRQCADAMDWKSFVTKPWIGRRGPTDQKISATPGGKQTANCFDRYRFSDMSPCSRADSPDIIGLGPAKYDFQHDGSERGFSSIVDLRRAKILNHLSVADFRGTRAFFPFRFEDLNMNGTAALLRSVEGATGFKAKCNATMGKAHWRRLGTDQITHHDELPWNLSSG